MFYTSRSSIELYQKCPRARYLHDFLLGTGIVPSGIAVPLATGSCIHAGIEHTLKRVKLLHADTTIAAYESFIKDETEIDGAVHISLSEYAKLVQDAGFTGKGMKSDRQQDFTYREQLALTEALVRAWCLTELPILLSRFEIVNVEREIENELFEGGILQSRVDAELKDKRNGDYFNYSLKTTKDFSSWTEKSYTKDLQGITEIWAVEENVRTLNRQIDMVVDGISYLIDMGLPNPKFHDINRYMDSRHLPNKKVAGVRFCFLVKGKFYSDRWDDKETPEEDKLWRTHSPLITGYRNITTNGILYAHSLYFPNPNNASGKGRLGKGWEPFNIFDEGSDFTVKQWIQGLYEKRWQSECGEVLRDSVVTPTEYFRESGEVEEGIREIKMQELSIISNMQYPMTDSNIIASTFPKHRSSCHYPQDCDYLPYCWPREGKLGDITSDPIGSGLYKIRVPHHEGERREHERLNKGETV